MSSPLFSTLHEFDTNLAAVELHRERVVLNKPYAVGFCVLDLAKREVYRIWYQGIKEMFKDGTTELLAHDTDSFIFKIEGIDDVNSILKANSDWFDFSTLSPTNCLRKHQKDINKQKPGCLKIELKDQICQEFCGVSPKCYSIKTNAGFKQTAKGCRQKLAHELYKNCLLQDSCYTSNVHEIRSYGQTLYQVSSVKRLISPLDTKRYYLNGMDSFSFGHYRTRQPENDRDDGGNMDI